MLKLIYIILSISESVNIWCILFEVLSSHQRPLGQLQTTAKIK